MSCRKAIDDASLNDVTTQSLHGLSELSPTVDAMANVGYARVSTRDQREGSQTDALGAAGCERIFIDHASGTLSTRPALTNAE